MANHHWKRTRETQDTSVQSFLKVVHKRTRTVCCIFEKLSALACRVENHYKKIASSCQSVWVYIYSLRPVQPKVTRSCRTLRSFETSNTLTTRSTSCLKGWEDIEVDNVKPQEIVSSLPLVTA